MDKLQQAMGGVNVAEQAKEQRVTAVGLAPAGDYGFSVVDAKWKQSKSNSESEYLNVLVELLEPDFVRGVNVWVMFHLLNAGPKAETTREIAQTQFAAFLTSIGLNASPPLEALKGKQGVARVGIKGGNYNADTGGYYDDSNEVVAWLPKGSAASGPANPRQNSLIVKSGNDAPRQAPQGQDAGGQTSNGDYIPF